MLSARWRRRAFCLQRNTTSRENPKGSLTPNLVSFFPSAGSCKRMNVAQRGKRVRERQQPWPARAACEIISSAKTEKLLSNIRGSIWHQTALCACLYGVSENVHQHQQMREKEGEEGRGKERRVERGPTVNCIAHWLLIESYGIHAGSDTLARGVKDHFALRGRVCELTYRQLLRALFSSTKFIHRNISGR